MAVDGIHSSEQVSQLFTSPSRESFEGMGTEELRERYLVRTLFGGEGVTLVYTDLDRLVLGGVQPITPTLLPGVPPDGEEFFLENREVGIINLGGKGLVHVDNAVYSMNQLDCLYVGKGNHEVVFEGCGLETPAFYLVSAPAHTAHPTRSVARGEAPFEEIGEETSCSRRRLVKVIHPGGVQSAQLVMGYTELLPGSVWNTMPAHTHLRRSEAYLYDALGEEVVVHLMGVPQRTRHLIVRNREAVLSPPWSIHCGCGTQPYRFVWAMAGENKDFSDIGPISKSDL